MTTKIPIEYDDWPAKVGFLVNTKAKKIYFINFLTKYFGSEAAVIVSFSKDDGSTFFQIHTFHLTKPNGIEEFDTEEVKGANYIRVALTMHGYVEDHRYLKVDPTAVIWTTDWNKNITTSHENTSNKFYVSDNEEKVLCFWTVNPFPQDNLPTPKTSENTEVDQHYTVQYENKTWVSAKVGNLGGWVFGPDTVPSEKGLVKIEGTYLNYNPSEVIEPSRVPEKMIQCLFSLSGSNETEFYMETFLLTGTGLSNEVLSKINLEGEIKSETGETKKFPFKHHDGYFRTDNIFIFKHGKDFQKPSVTITVIATINNEKQILGEKKHAFDNSLVTGSDMNLADGFAIDGTDIAEQFEIQQFMVLSTNVAIVYNLANVPFFCRWSNQPKEDNVLINGSGVIMRSETSTELIVEYI